MVRRSREWRQRFNLPEAELSHGGQDQDRSIERTVDTATADGSVRRGPTAGTGACGTR